MEGLRPVAEATITRLFLSGGLPAGAAGAVEELTLIASSCGPLPRPSTHAAARRPRAARRPAGVGQEMAGRLRAFSLEYVTVGRQA
jgi:hypothetical protein